MLAMRLAAPLLLALLAAAPAAAQGAAEREAQGAALAERWCASCHAGAGPRAGDSVPSFAAIATRPGVSTANIVTFLRVPHGGMPDFALTLPEAEALAAHILAQRPR
jgi:mono/diheme cytochrome c family protein